MERAGVFDPGSFAKYGICGVRPESSGPRRH